MLKILIISACDCTLFIIASLQVDFIHPLSLPFQESFRKSKDELNTKIKKLTEVFEAYKENYNSSLVEIEKWKKSYDDEKMEKIHAVNKLGKYISLMCAGIRGRRKLSRGEEDKWLGMISSGFANNFIIN